MTDNNNMNTQEGHLGGYIMASDSPAPSGLDITHGDPATWFPELWLWAVSALNIRSVLDVGCGEGHCIEFFSRYGCEVEGVDGSKLAREHSRLSEHHTVHDFIEGPYRPDSSYDLVWCCEFVEHVEERFSDHFLETFKSANTFIMMTHALPGQPGWHHVNCQPMEYWIGKLDKIGFDYHISLTQRARAICRGGHFKNKGLVFVKR